MNGFNLCNDIAVYLRNYTPLNTYCDQKFNKRLNFLVGFDSRNPPEEALIPFVALVPSARQNTETTHDEHTLMFAVVCTDDEKSTSQSITQYEGYQTIDALANKVFEGIEAYISEKAIEVSLLSWTAAQYSGYWPEYHATREITVATALENI